MTNHDGHTIKGTPLRQCSDAALERERDASIAYRDKHGHSVEQKRRLKAIRDEIESRGMKN